MTTPLAQRLLGLIANHGPITVAEYMAACLNDPDYGYYQRNEPFGPRGDFVTSPEISQIFGEVIGLWCLLVWEALDKPSRFGLVELGPGRGTMMADILRAARIRPAFGAAARLFLLEASPRLRAVQATTLEGIAPEPTWIDDVHSLPDLPHIVVANEFFDALPVHQWQRTAGGWAERMVVADKAGRLTFGLGPAGTAPFATPAKPGTIMERRPAAEAIVTELSRRFMKRNGGALFIDYGHATVGFGDTLQAVRRHRSEDIFAKPGEADLTAHVDFAALAEAAMREGAVPAPTTTQGEFLTKLGIGLRAERLAEGKDEATREAIEAAQARLVDPDAMGRLFKVFAFGGPKLALPVL